MGDSRTTGNEENWLERLVLDSVAAHMAGGKVLAGRVRCDATHRVSLIGFYGDGGAGVLGVTASEYALELCAPEIGGRRLDPGDWIGEMANQLLGAIKRSLASHGVTVHSAAPIVLDGIELQVEPTDTQRTFVLRRGGTVINLWIDTALLMEEEPVLAGDCEGYLGEGEILLFN